MKLSTPLPFYLSNERGRRKTSLHFSLETRETCLFTICWSGEGRNDATPPFEIKHSLLLLLLLQKKDVSDTGLEPPTLYYNSFILPLFQRGIAWRNSSQDGVVLQRAFSVKEYDLHTATRDIFWNHSSSIIIIINQSFKQQGKVYYPTISNYIQLSNTLITMVIFRRSFKSEKRASCTTLPLFPPKYCGEAEMLEAELL